jgi:O-antigen/teichoic acid export membrane protein
MGVIARQSIKGALANYLGVAIGFVTTFFVVTRFLTTEEVGLTRVMVDAAMLFSSLAQLGSNSSLIRFFPHFKDRASHHGIFGLSLLVPMAGFFVFALVFLLFHDQLLTLYSERSPLLTDYFYMVPMLTFFALYTTVFETGASVLMRITVPKMVREVGIRVFNLVAYLLYGYHVISLDVFVWLFCGSYGLAMLLNMVYLLRISGLPLTAWLHVDWAFVADGRRWRDMLRYTLFMTATVLAGNIPLMSSLFLGAQAGLAVTGVYTIAFYIANVVEVPYRSLGAISRPVVAAAVKEGDWAEVNRLGRQVSLHQLLVSLAIFFVIWINLDALFTLIPNGADYRGGAGVVLLLGLAKVMNSSFSIGTDVLNYSRWYSRSLVLIAVLTLSAIALNGVLIGVWDINGAAAATLLSYGLYFVLLLTLLWRRLRVSLFSWAQLKTLAIAGAALGLDRLWSLWLSPLVTGWAGGVWGLVVDAVLKTAVVGGLFVAAVLAWRVSPTVNEMVFARLRPGRGK